MPYLYLGVFSVALVVSLFATWYIRNLAVARGWLSRPSKRDVHVAPLPRLGGVAIFLSFIVVIGFALALSRLAGHELPFALKDVLYVTASATLVFFVGLYDDVRPISPYFKLAVQILAALILFLGGFGVYQLQLLFGAREFEWLLALFLTALWVMAITNAFNLIDGVDGLAAGSALFSIVTVFVISMVNHTNMVSLLAVALAGATLGFLRFNFSPATIFLGDSGSLFLGFMLSALALAGAQKSAALVAVAIPVVCFGLPIVDTAIAIVRRFLSGQPIFAADREHIHHKLLDRGLSPRQVVITLYAVSAAFGMLSLLLLSPGGAAIGIVLFVVGAGVWLGVQRLGYHEVSEIVRVASRTVEQRKIIRNNLALRRATEALAKADTYEAITKILEEAFLTNDFDGFDLHLESSWQGESPGQVLSSEPVADVRSAWRKTSGADGSEDGKSPSWRLTLDLITGDNRTCGTFSVFKRYDVLPLLVDVNLLTSGFHSALASAVDRAWGRRARGLVGQELPLSHFGK